MVTVETKILCYIIFAYEKEGNSIKELQVQKGRRQTMVKM